MYYRLMYEDMTDKELMSFNPKEQTVLKCMTMFHLNILTGTTRMVAQFGDPYRCVMRARKILASGGRCAMYGCRRSESGDWWYAHVPITLFSRMREVDGPEPSPMRTGALH